MLRFTTVKAFAKLLLTADSDMDHFTESLDFSEHFSDIQLQLLELCCKQTNKQIRAGIKKHNLLYKSQLTFHQTPPTNSHGPITSLQGPSNF